MKKQDAADFDEATHHPCLCECDKCLNWWAQMVRTHDGEECYGPFTQEQVNQRQRELHIKVTK